MQLELYCLMLYVKVQFVGVPIIEDALTIIKKKVI